MGNRSSVRSTAPTTRWRTTDGRLLNRKELVQSGRRAPATVSHVVRPRRSFGTCRLPRNKRHRVTDRRPLRPSAKSLPRCGASLQLRGSRPSYLEKYESMDRITSPLWWGRCRSQTSGRQTSKPSPSRCSREGLSPKTARNVLTYVYSVFEYGIERGLVSANPVRHVTRPGRRRQGDVSPDLRFLTVEELEAVIRAIPDEVVDRAPAPTRAAARAPPRRRRPTCWARCSAS